MTNTIINVSLTLAFYAIAVIAGVYAKNKTKINKTTRTGQVVDIIGRLATWAVHESEYLDLENAQKRETAANMVKQGLSLMGIHNIDANLINGAVETAVNAMHLANNDTGNAITDAPVNDADVMQPVDQLDAEKTANVVKTQVQKVLTEVTPPKGGGLNG